MNNEKEIMKNENKNIFSNIEREKLMEEKLFGELNEAEKEKKEFLIREYHYYKTHYDNALF